MIQSIRREFPEICKRIIGNHVGYTIGYRGINCYDVDKKVFERCFIKPIKERMKYYNNMTFCELMRRTEIEESTLYNILNNKCFIPPNRLKLIKIAQVLNIKNAYFLIYISRLFTSGTI